MSDAVGGPDPVGLPRSMRDLGRFLMPYKFGLDEIATKVNILREELTFTHDYNPIEHVESRLKSPDSIQEKARRLGCDGSVAEIAATIFDIAGIRIVCSFTTDVYEVAQMLTTQSDLTLVRTRDYITTPKPNGYRSLHLLVEVPVFLSDRVQPVCVEVQLRTVAMDFWASLEHKAIYKFEGEVPSPVLEELAQAADITRELDARVEALRADIVGRPGAPGRTPTAERRIAEAPGGYAPGMTTAPLEPVTDPGARPDTEPDDVPEVNPVAPGEDPGATPQSDPDVVPSGPQVVPAPGSDPDQG